MRNTHFCLHVSDIIWISYMCIRMPGFLKIAFFLWLVSQITSEYLWSVNKILIVWIYPLIYQILDLRLVLYVVL